jgi:hypothetical protein
MTYDAVLVARRGLGPTELRLAQPAFLRAVRWALFAEKAGDGLAEMRAAAATETPDGLTGAALTTFMVSRSAVRDQLAETERLLYPKDDDG